MKEKAVGLLPTALTGGQVRCMALGCAALTLLGTWLNMAGRGGMFSQSSPAEAQTVFYACRLASLLVMALAYRWVYRRAPQVSLLCGCLIVLGTVVRLLVLQSNGSAAFSPQMQLVGNALCGLGYLPCIVLVYFGLAQALDLKTALLAVLVALICKQQLPSLVLGLPAATHPWALVGILLLLTATLVGFWDAWRPAGRRTCELAADARHYTVALGDIAGFSLFVFGAISGIGLVGADDSSATHGMILTPFGKLTALAIFVALSWFLIMRRIGRPLIGRFIPAFIALALSTALATLVGALDTPAVTGTVAAYLMGLYDFNQFLVWTLVVCVCQQRSPSVVRSAVAIVVVYDTLATFVGPLSLDAFSTYGSNLVSIFGLVIAIVATVVLPFAMARSASKKSQETDANPFELHLEAETDEYDYATRLALRDAMQERCSYVAERHGLTSRESEVFCLLCQGHSRAAIGEDLCMAEGTVKTHIAHIYEKMGVNTREALSALVFMGEG